MQRLCHSSSTARQIILIASVGGWWIWNKIIKFTVQFNHFHYRLGLKWFIDYNWWRWESILMASELNAPEYLTTFPFRREDIWLLAILSTYD